MFQASLEYMTAKAWIQMAKESNRQALKLLASLFGKQSLPYTLLESAQSVMKPVSEHTLHVTTTLIYEMQSLSALLNSTKPWDPKYKEVAQHLTSAMACLLSAAEFPNKENQEAARELFKEEEIQPETAEKALVLADKVLTKIAADLPQIKMPPPLTIP
ncbi:unnamed protein product [Nippostrongylus brasiliensis]|uniref:BRO1 domain-containing protein n=1 Tax=Nippostrongylus brasiliensis TaxID=27835 RepID=A0A0N4YAE3_NIPBR|nr:unnamed protein product [Nippostrongylus brasiliensis]